MLSTGVPVCNRSRRLRYHVYFIPIDVQLKDTIALAYGNSLTEEFSEVVGYASAKAMEADGPIGKEMKDGDDKDAPEMESYFITSEISTKCIFGLSLHF